MHNPKDVDTTIRSANFFEGRDFKEFMVPLIEHRRQCHLENYISKGGEEWRLKIRELDDLLGDVRTAIDSAEGIREERE